MMNLDYRGKRPSDSYRNAACCLSAKVKQGQTAANLAPKTRQDRFLADSKTRDGGRGKELLSSLLA